MSSPREEVGLPDRVRPLVAALHSLHLQAGKPSMRTISGAVGNVSHTTVAELINGKRIPSWPIVESVVRYLQGDVGAFQQLWIAATDDAAGVGEELQKEQRFFAEYRELAAIRFG